MKIKILHILHSLQIGGLENGVVNLINNLDDTRFEHSICCIDSSGPVADRLKRDVEIYTLNKGKKRDYVLPFKLTRIIKRLNPDIVHTRNWGTIDGVIGAKLAGVKHVIHGEHGREATDPAGRNNLRKWARKALNPIVSRFITVSNDLQRWLVNEVKIPADKVSQIINGVDTTSFSPSEDKRRSREKIGVNPDSFVIGMVGRLDPVKDHETLFRSFKIFCDRRKNEEIILLIVGSGPLQGELETLAKDLNISNKLIFTGDRNDIALLYNCMDVYVLASIAEGISNTILEAMACGLPSIVTGIGGNVELIKEGETGFIFNTCDCVELAEKLSFYFHNSPILRIHGSKARMMAEKKFSLSRMIDEYEKLYFEVAGYC